MKTINLHLRETAMLKGFLISYIILRKFFSVVEFDYDLERFFLKLSIYMVVIIHE